MLFVMTLLMRFAALPVTLVGLAAMLSVLLVSLATLAVFFTMGLSATTFTYNWISYCLNGINCCLGSSFYCLQILCSYLR